ncbi:NTP transferase domain-containing protein [Rheinheimera sp. MM224]|uniref:nucleotidyltransferase family protein n=1 Tax=Rheinheimera sp. MM224 TaxID=3019969 RepID=UPI0021F8CC23|nr:nucleotidyltransferase family protein [Rheinheimera sp. MM224]CAI3798365.1 hypothetical protein JAMGFMIE_02053 [Rheinheimera sp. MM224]
MTRLVTIILAAGNSSRFGGCKLLADAAGTPVLGRVLQQAMVCFDGPLYLISGYWHQDILGARARGEIADIPVLYHSHWNLGMGQSISFAVNQLADQYDGVVIVLADQINIQAEDFLRLRDAFKDADAACALYDGRRGAPAIFAPSLFSELKQLSGEQGAKALLYNPSYRITEVAMENANCDIDTREALQQWLIAYQDQGTSAVSSDQTHQSIRGSE